MRWIDINGAVIDLRYCPHPDCYDRDGKWEGCRFDDDDAEWSYPDAPTQ